MDLPKLHLHCGSSKYKGKSYRSYSLARAYRDENGKKCKEIVLKLGKLSDDEVDNWRNFLRSVKDPKAFFTTTDNIIVSKHFDYLDIAAVSAIWDEWLLDSVFNISDEKNISTAGIARILTINRSINPRSKSQTPRWCQGTILPWMLNFKPQTLNVSRVFRELYCIERHKESLCQHLFSLMQKKDPQAMATVFYDLSSTKFYGSKCVLMKWGHCKEGYENHIVLAIVVNKEGLPFYWEVLPGGTADSNTIIWLMDRLQQRFKAAGATVVFDRGMVSDDNLALIEEANIKYISAMDKNQIEKITCIDFNQFFGLDFKHIANYEQHLAGFTKLNDMTYYRDAIVQGQRRYILCFNPVLFTDQRHAREQQIADFMAFVESLNAEYKEAKNTRQSDVMLKKCNEQLASKKLGSFVQVNIKCSLTMRKDAKDVSYSVSICHAEVTINETEKQKASRLDGFWLLVTNHSEKEQEQFTMAAPDAIDPYREKVVIESAFRDIKSFVEIAPVYVWTADHVKAHFTICVLSYLINRTITLKLHQNLGEKTKDIVAHEKFYQALADCRIDQIQIKNKNMMFYQMTQQNLQQAELLDRVSLNQLRECKNLKQMNELAMQH
jgi:transposase